MLASGAMAADTITLTVAHAGAGTGTTSPTVGSHVLTLGDPLVISASPDPGSYFGGWLVNITDVGEFPLNVYSYSGDVPPADTSLTATFTTSGYSLTTDISGNGSVDPPVGSYRFSTDLEVPLTATPNGAAVFDHWEDGSGNTISTDNPTSVVMGADKFYIAVFEEPITGSIAINNNQSVTKSADVNLNLTWGGGSGSGVVRMRFSDNGANWSAWEPLKATRAYTLPAGDGYKTVRVQFLDQDGNRSDVFSDYIRVDATAPTGGISINGGAWGTYSTAVTLSLSWNDGTGTGVTGMRFSSDGANWTLWEPVATTRSFTLPGPAGSYNTVRVQYRDRAGNYSAVYNDYIKVLVP